MMLTLGEFKIQTHKEKTSCTFCLCLFKKKTFELYEMVFIM